MTDKNKKDFGFSSLKGIHKAVPIALGVAAVLIALCLISPGMGALGGGIKALLRGLFSWGAILIPVSLIFHALCYASDLANKKILSRAIFSSVTVLLASCIDYAVFTWGNDAVFTPGQGFANMSCGGFIGGIFGFLLTAIVGQLGVIILSVVIIAIYALFFFAEKAGALGQIALKISARVKKLIAFIKDKQEENAEKKRQLKEDEDQHRRELTAEELSDDEFFKAKGEAADIKIKQLGIEENATTHGISPLLDPDKRIPEEEPVVIETPEPRRRRSDKPIDTTYGLEDQVTEEVVAEEQKPTSTRSMFGLDDTADNVFTKDFDPFDFATNEKKAAKYASKVSSPSAVTEELDEMTLYEMKANHEPDERERRLMELERKKQEWMNKRKISSPSAHQSQSAPVAASTVATLPKTEPVAEPVKVEEPAKVITQAPMPETTPTTVSHNIPTPVSTPTAHSNGVYSSYTAARATYTQPVKPVEFVVSKSPRNEVPVHPVSEPKAEINSNTKPDDDAEDVAILISQRIAKSMPGYARSANDLKTYTKVVSSEDDELYRQLEGINTPAELSEGAPAAEGYALDEPSATEPMASEEIFAPASGFDSEPEEVKLPEPIEFIVGEPKPEYAENNEQATSEPVAEPVSAPVVEAAPTPEFKPYATPTSAIQTAFDTASADEEAKLKVERSMLSPTITPSFSSDDAEPVSDTEPTPIEPPAPVSDEIDFEPADESSSEPIFEGTDSDEVSAEPLFSVIDEETSEDEDADDESEEEEEIGFDPADDDDGEDEEADNDEAEDDAEDDEAENEEEEDADNSEQTEIPPEEQNPDVIKMRQMFPFLNPIGEQATPAESVEEDATKNAPGDDDLPPFDDPVEVKPAPAATAIVPVDDKKAGKKKNKPDYSDYRFPPLDFLASQEELRDDNIAIETQENADKLIETLASFGVTAFTKGMDRGPRITRYEVVPAKGVKVSSILNLQDDIALNLAAGSIRMEAPIPGKSAVGIEIPNKKSSIVRLRDLLETPDFENEKSKTFVCIGRDVAGQPVFGDLAKMPHLLIAGATGMGKSVCINSLLISVLYKARPDEVKLIMIDPKQVEFTMYNGIPHLLVPVVSDPKQAAGALMWAVEEMERRFDMLKPLCVRNIDAYNEKVAEDPSLGDPMPKIIIVIDEFADLMLQVKDPVEALVMRIAQKARAAGIHLVIGTQRPSVNVITGVIKANVPSRISCKVMSNVDSKTVLDSGGAEKLLDKGDALYAPSGSPKPHRVQCAFVSDGEVETIMNYLKQYSDGDTYDSTVMEDIERAAQKCSKKGGGGDRDDSDASEGSGEGYLNDRQFLDAVDIAVNTRKISTSLIQRKMSIGYGKAAKFIDVMEDMGIVGPANGQRPRDVLLTPDEWREKLARATLE